jgi:hypothetical protein
MVRSASRGMSMTVGEYEERFRFSAIAARNVCCDAGHWPEATTVAAFLGCFSFGRRDYCGKRRRAAPFRPRCYAQRLANGALRSRINPYTARRTIAGEFGCNPGAGE